MSLPAATAPPGPSLPSPARAFRWGFHGILALTSLALLSTVSTPGVSGWTLLLASAVLAAGGLVWLVWLVASTVRRRWSRWLLVAPVGGLAVLGLMLSGAPLAARWALSKGDFEAQVRAVQQLPAPAGEREDVRVPSFVGLYQVTRAVRVPDGGVLFYEGHGNGLVDEAGFAYLPKGPSPSLSGPGFEVSFQHLDGPWYTWTASW